MSASGRLTDAAPVGSAQQSPGPPPSGAGPQPPPLERAIERMRAQDPAPWGWRPVVLPCTALLVLVAVGYPVTRLIRPHTFNGKLVFTITANLVVQGLLVLAIWWAGRDIAARHGGWGPTFGWRRPTRADVPYAAAGLGIAFAARVLIVAFANAFSGDRATSESQNLYLHSTSIAVITVLIILTVLCAPPIEELMFRGLLLRTFMTRIGFWPAAIASTVIFAAFHTYEVNTLTGAITLAAVVASLGLTNCMLVRLTNRLAPGILVHAAFNTLAAIVLIAQAAH